MKESLACSHSPLGFQNTLDTRSCSDLLSVVQHELMRTAIAGGSPCFCEFAVGDIQRLLIYLIADMEELGFHDSISNPS